MENKAENNSKQVQKSLASSEYMKVVINGELKGLKGTEFSNFSDNYKLQLQGHTNDSNLMTDNNYNNQHEENQDEHTHNFNLAVVEVPTVVKTDESQVLALNLDSPNKVLQVTHKLGEEETNSLGEANQSIAAKETDDSGTFLDHISRERYLSPRVMKTTRKGKRQDIGESTQPIRVQPKRNKVISY
ncbi:hypothetical protein KY290_021355 [Solanum tuberosum]|uniref:Uncharacterized protein n=1 Tax=Solanum tuberosum TaxID=4113 RepID=A0ABQ7V1B9_SOLTU|nr:hypothetical protein KY289_020517 [Solanum tuberosum]KAH0693179.1 hypothetical protein KY285_020276 [Solanum tuberosum]KAH0757862.1 hypothetical protein KY290_021355 [Solanum tuberosum]